MEKQRTGRIVRSISGFYDVQAGDAVITCRARGILRKENCTPLTGDMVSITVERGKGMVEKVLPRRNCFVRPAVANIDALVVLAANVNPVTEPFLIDRVAAIAGDQEVPVYLCVNKCDLDPAVDLVRIYRNAGFPVICTSAETGGGVEELRTLIRGKLVAFTGNSGVGKSSILNRLAPEPPARFPKSSAADGTPPGTWSCTVWATTPSSWTLPAFPPSTPTKWT